MTLVPIVKRRYTYRFSKTTTDQKLELVKKTPQKHEEHNQSFKNMNRRPKFHM
jgi:hypothetical protein